MNWARKALDEAGRALDEDGKALDMVEGPQRCQQRLMKGKILTEENQKLLVFCVENPFTATMSWVNQGVLVSP